MSAKDVLSIILSGLALVVSLVTFGLNYKTSLDNSVLARKPVLIFEYESKDGWGLRNIGTGPALNVLVAQRGQDGKWFYPVRIPPLSKEGRFPLKWLGHINSTDLGATYSDTENLPYTAICANDLSKVAEGTGFGPWTEEQITKYWRLAVFR